MNKTYILFTIITSYHNYDVNIEVYPNFASLIPSQYIYLCVGRCGVRPFVGCPTRWEVLIKIVPRARAKETDSQGPATLQFFDFFTLTRCIPKIQGLPIIKRNQIKL